MTLEMRNTATGETAPAHLIGETAQGQSIYQHIEGWELVGVESTCDEDGNYLV